MTLPHEEVRALKLAGEFLRDLIDPKATPRVPGPVRRRAIAVLRHYPHIVIIKERWGEDAEPPWTR